VDSFQGAPFFFDQIFITRTLAPLVNFGRSVSFQVRKANSITLICRSRCRSLLCDS
jgi:hypothetical protein